MEDIENIADETHVEKKARLERVRREQELNDLKALLDKPEFQRFMWRLLGECRMYESSFTGNSVTFYNEGKRAVGIFLHQEIIEAKPESFIEMMTKANKGVL